jgi:hypothetical protein
MRTKEEIMKASRLLTALSASAFCLLSASPALGLANRVFVSARSGNNANSCDNIFTPCQTLAGAVLQLNPGGEAIVLDSGGYGAVTVTQAVTIEAPPGVLAFIHPSSGDAITVSAGASDVVVLRGLILNVGPNNGIIVNSVGSLYVESCVVNGFTLRGLAFLGSGALFIKDSIFRNNGNHGVALGGFNGAGSVTASIDHCRFEGNGFGTTFDSGLIIFDHGKGTVRDSVASGNEHGFEAYTIHPGTSAELNVESCVAAGNINRGLSAGGAVGTNGGTLRVSNTTSTDNDNGVITFNGGQALSRQNNTVEGNTTDGAFTGTYTAK